MIDVAFRQEDATTRGPLAKLMPFYHGIYSLICSSWQGDAFLDLNPRWLKREWLAHAEVNRE